MPMWKSPTIVFDATKDRETIAGVRQLLVGVVFSSAGISKTFEIPCENSRSGSFLLVSMS